MSIHLPYRKPFRGIELYLLLCSEISPKKQSNSFISFLADLFSKYIFNLYVRVQVI